MKRFAEQWTTLLEELLNITERSGPRLLETNRRTKSLVSIADGARFIQMDLSDGILPTCGYRKTFPYAAAAETAWQLMGHDHTDWLRRHTKIWDKFTDDIDCITCEGRGHTPPWTTEQVECPKCYGTGLRHFTPFAYGYRWRAKHRDQIYSLIQALKKNPSDRRTWVSAWDPVVDGLGAEGQKNVPCPVGFSTHIVGGRLNMSVTLRSSDVFVGLPYDVMTYAMTAAVLATDLDVPLGILSFTLDNAHLYGQHFEMAGMCLGQKLAAPPIKMAKWKLEHVTRMPDEFVEWYKTSAQLFNWPRYSPKPEVIV